MLVTVTGDYKPGRVVVELTDFTVPIAGLPITIGRRYDSLEKDKVGDFGHGWSLAIGHPRLEVNPDFSVTSRCRTAGARRSACIAMQPGADRRRRRSTCSRASYFPSTRPSPACSAR